LTCREGVRKMKRLKHDFLNAESEYRTVQISYVNLMGSYLTASQLNFAVGREVIP
jgi:outer membrane protein, heavy metal efflux system